MANKSLLYEKNKYIDNTYVYRHSIGINKYFANFTKHLSKQ